MAIDTYTSAPVRTMARGPLLPSHQPCLPWSRSFPDSVQVSRCHWHCGEGRLRVCLIILIGEVSACLGEVSIVSSLHTARVNVNGLISARFLCLILEATGSSHDFILQFFDTTSDVGASPSIYFNWAHVESHVRYVNSCTKRSWGNAEKQGRAR